MICGVLRAMLLEMSLLVALILTAESPELEKQDKYFKVLDKQSSKIHSSLSVKWVACGVLSAFLMGNQKLRKQ